MHVGLLVFAVHVTVLPAPRVLCMLGKRSTTVPHLCDGANPMWSLSGQSGSWANGGLFYSFSSWSLVFCWRSDPQMWNSELRSRFEGNVVGTVCWTFLFATIQGLFRFLLVLVLRKLWLHILWLDLTLEAKHKGKDRHKSYRVSYSSWNYMIPLIGSACFIRMSTVHSSCPQIMATPESWSTRGWLKMANRSRKWREWRNFSCSLSNLPSFLSFFFDVCMFCALHVCAAVCTRECECRGQSRVLGVSLPCCLEVVSH